jgi:hypothetical protein
MANAEKFSKAFDESDNIIAHITKPDGSSVHVTFTSQQLVAAINEYLPSTTARLERQYIMGEGPITNLFWLAAGMTDDEVETSREHPGQVIETS